MHTWPEHDYAAVDLFSCGTTLDHAAIGDWIRTGLHATSAETRELTRG
ncbi:MAG: S-adenosylmethionine decarboxylase [Verrucomicrobiota bacterium]|nr:S-adenosylmethionine decarboxylase [Verrucomicrobiota bacterium]